MLSRDPDTGEEACQAVVGLKVTPEQSVLSVELTANDGATVSYHVTPTRPFRVVGQGWKAAGALAPGDEVCTSHGGWLKVTGSTWLQARQTVYDFEVARFHTYFVGKAGAWVHNNCDIKITQRGLDHVINRHTVEGSRAAGKSVFNGGEDVKALIKQAESISPTKQARGNFERIVDAGRDIGVDRATGASTSTYTVITNQAGELVTAFPGTPGG